MLTLEPAVLDLLAEAPVARAVTVADRDDFVAALAAEHAAYAPVVRPNQAGWAARELRGRGTAAVGRKPSDARGLRLLGAGPAAANHVRAAPYVSRHGAGDAAALRIAPQRLVAQTLGEDDGGVRRDGREAPTPGRRAVGVARQGGGATGTRATGQAGGALAYASRPGATRLARRR